MMILGFCKGIFMKQSRLEELEKSETAKQIMNFIPNNLGINLCSVKDIEIKRKKDGQIKKIKIEFIPI